MDNSISFYRVLQIMPQDFPVEFLKNMNKWDTIVKSPYGHSYYNAQPDWNYKKPNSLRIADHWNFRCSRGNIHCLTTTSCPDKSHWTIAKFDGELNKYVVITSIPKIGVSNRKSLFVKMNNLNFGYDRAITRIKESLGDSKYLTDSVKKCELSYLNRYYEILEQN